MPAPGSKKFPGKPIKSVDARPATPAPAMSEPKVQVPFASASTASEPVIETPAAAPAENIIATTPVVAAGKAPEKKVAIKKAPVVKAPVAAEAKPTPSVPTAASAAAPLTPTADPVITTPAAAPVATNLQEETPKMATAFETPKFETPKLVSDFNDRAKAGFEKSTKLVQEVGDFGKGNVEAIVESTRIAAKGFEALGQDAAEYGRKSFEGLTATLKNMASIKSPADFFNLQSEYLRASFDSAVAQSSKSTEAMIKLAGDAAQPLSSRFALAAEKVKAVA